MYAGRRATRWPLDFYSKCRSPVNRLFSALLILVASANLALDARSAEVLRVDEARARAAGIRKLAGRHLVLFTDVPSSPEVDRLPAIFDLALPQWAEYFGVDPQKTRSFQA